MKLLVTCSGLSNTGRLTTQVALSLMRSRPGLFEWARAQESPAELPACAEGAEEIVVIDGCGDRCAAKKLDAAGILHPSRRHVVATGCGVVKNGMADVQYGEIGIVVQAVLDSGGSPG